MKKRLGTLWRFGKETAVRQVDRVLEHTCTGRVVSALTFFGVVFCQGLWIIVFLLLKDIFFTKIFLEMC